jgi:hypothetical protein
MEASTPDPPWSIFRACGIQSYFSDILWAVTTPRANARIQERWYARKQFGFTPVRPNRLLSAKSIMGNVRKEHTSYTERASTEKHETFVDTASTDHHAVLTSILKTQPVKTWGSGSLHLYAVCLLVYLCSTMNGMSSSGRGSNVSGTY